MDRLVLSLLVENNPGVLNRVAGLFSRRGYNIESISVGQTNIKGMSRMTVVSTGDEQILTQIEKQLGKLVEVVEIEKLEPDDSVYRELVLIKVDAMLIKEQISTQLLISLEHILSMFHQLH